MQVSFERFISFMSVKDRNRTHLKCTQEVISVVQSEFGGLGSGGTREADKNKTAMTKDQIDLMKSVVAPL